MWVLLLCGVFFWCIFDDSSNYKKSRVQDYTLRQWAEQNWKVHNSNNREENWDDDYTKAYSNWCKNGKKENEIPNFLRN
jgi:hypothetical protein